MLEARLSNGLVVRIYEELKTFMNGEERGMWFDAVTVEPYAEDRTKLIISSKQVVAIREINK